tara:strand:+ start:489 stop:1184 length:696 start_codon:yes stop_codon:yes gene_type:complete
MKNAMQTITIAILLLTGTIATTLIGSDETGVFGPVDTITLGSGNDSVNITNRDSRIAFGEATTSTVWSMGFMEVGKALSQMMEASHFVDARTELQKNLEERLQEARDVLDIIMGEAQALPQDSDEHPAMRQRWDQAMGEFQQLQQIATEQQGALFASQMIEAYEEIITAVEVVAENKNVDVVLRFIAPDEPIETSNPDVAIMQIRLRTALTYPKGIDLTDDVLTELGLESQ